MRRRGAGNTAGSNGATTITHWATQTVHYIPDRVKKQLNQIIINMIVVDVKFVKVYVLWVNDQARPPVQLWHTAIVLAYSHAFQSIGR